MAKNRKLGRTSAVRRSMLKGLVTALIVNGKIKTTATRAAEVQRKAEKMITLAIKEKDNFDTAEKEVSRAKLDSKGRKLLKKATSKNDNVYDVVEREMDVKMVQVDHPSRLQARRKLISQMNEFHNAEGKRVNTVNYLFNEVAPRYIDRKGGYSRIIKIGPRRGDAAEMVILELL
ncbi:MAG: 50S ribosomal protein L17 [Clostridiaceae bacterium]|nr:50S ribosomal protein L17 [Clostridiaceae bacterium]